MRIQKLNSPQYSTSFCANPIKKATPQKYPDSKNNNYAYCPKMLATALAMATITTGCNINSNKHELQYEKEKYLKSEILTQTNRTNFERNDSIIKGGSRINRESPFRCILCMVGFCFSEGFFGAALSCRACPSFPNCPPDSSGNSPCAERTPFKEFRLLRKATRTLSWTCKP